MKRHYSSSGALFLFFLSFVTWHANGQFAECSSVMPEFEEYDYTQVQSWNTSDFLSYQYDSPEAGASDLMRFRLLVPNGYSCGNATKYPLIVFLHGSGESAPYDANPFDASNTQDNDKHLVHGGQRHKNAVANNTFQGFVLYPQIRKSSNNNNYWGIDNILAVRYIIDKLITDYKVDPDRIYIHGLSMGGEGTWIFLSNFPEYFAAAHVMSAAGSNFTNGTSADVDNYIHIPLRMSQGGLDSNPTPLEGNNQVNTIRSAGGNLEYTYYPNTGHATWNMEYAKSDFFSWFLARQKNMIMVLDGQTSFCPEDPVSPSNPVTLGLSPGFVAYEWAEGNTGNIISGATSNEYQATAASTYFARYQRTAGVWETWSPAVVLDNNKGPSPTPSITTDNQSVNLPPLDGSPNVTLIGTAGKEDYTWTRNGSSLATDEQTVTVNTAGSYTLRAKDPQGTGLEADNDTPTKFRATPQGCLSDPSEPVVVTTSNGVNVPAIPGNFFGSATGPTSITLAWDDRSADELGFEIYRTTTPGSNYKLIAIHPASDSPNPQTYVDNSELQANATYYYRMRAVNASGGSGYTPEIAVFTAVDNAPPTAPALVVVATSRTAIDLSWSGATDNIAVHEYDIYQNGSLVATVPATTTTYHASGLIAFASYSFVVKARDAAGNTSPPSNQVNPSAVNTGLFYSYYEHENNVNLTSQIIPNSTLVTTGYMPKFNITPRNRDDGFAFIHEGFINIPTSGSYTFSMTSDNGSALYVNNVLVVNHDGNHSCTEKNGTPITLSAGTYPIKAMYFEKTGGQCLTVSWAGPGFSKQEIPNSALSDTSPPPAPITAPNTVVATAIGPNRIDLTWVGPSNNETGFEIYRATATGGPYQVVHLTAANATSWSDTGLSPGIQYFYRVRAINAETASPFGTPNPVNATTTNPSAPGVPVGLAAVPASATRIDLTWNDNSDESGYELQRSSSATDGFVTFATTAANITSISDTQVNGHTTVYYKIRALGNGTVHSPYSPVVSATTPNRAPVFSPAIPDQTLTAGSGSAQTLNITVNDPDSDPITFNVTDMPEGGSFESDGFGRGVFSFTNVAAGDYTITVEASDGADMVSDQFLLTFSGNANPVVAVTIPNPWNGTLTTEEGRTAQIRFSVTDPDGNAQLNNTPVITGLPDFGVATGWTNSGTGARTLTINFTPEIGDAAQYPVTVTFRDSQNGITIVNFDLVVLQLDPTWSISVNFTINDAKNEGSPWNNSGPPSATGTDDKINLRDESGNIVKFVTLNTGLNWLTANQPASELPAGPGAVFTEKVRESYYRKSSTNPTDIIFKNLNPLLQYKATVYGAFAEATGTRLTSYTVLGAGSEDLPPINTVNNISQTETSGFFFPDANGLFRIRVGRGADNGAHYYINAIILTAQLPTGDAPAAPSGLTLSAPSHDSVVVSWTDNSFNETGFQILRSATLNGTYNIVGTTADNITTFTNSPVAGRTTYYYKVRAVNGSTFSPETAPLVITTPNGAPVIADPGSISAPVGQTTQHDIAATDPEGDDITFTALDLPAFATLVDNGNGTGFVRVTPQQSNIGSHLFTLRATDSFGTHTDRDVTIVVLDADVGEIVFINFKGAGAAGNAPAPWNNKVINDAPGLLNSEGQASTIQLTSDFTVANATNSGGVSTENNSGIFPDRVMQSYWYTTSTAPGQNITLSGLDPDARYNLTLFGSTDEFWFSNTTYTIAGHTPAILNTTKNTSNTVRLTGIAPVGTSIVINVKRGVTPSVTEREGRIGAMIIESYLPDPGGPPLDPTNLTAEALSRTEIMLKWFDNASDETGYEVSRATTQTGPFTPLPALAANADTFTDAGLTPNTAYFYRVRALKGGNNSGYTNDATDATYEQIIQISLNYPDHLQAENPAPDKWNNTASIPETGLSFDNLVDNNNNPTDISLTILNQESGAGNQVQNVGTISPGIYPDNVLANFYFYEQFDTPMQYALSGLDPNYTYDLVFFGSEWDYTHSNFFEGINSRVATDYTVGGITLSQFNGRNSTETVIFEGLRPNADGTLTFQIKANDAAKYGVWNALEIRSHTVDAVVDTEPPTVPQNLVASDITDSGFQISWNASTDNTAVATYEVFLGSELAATIAHPDTFAVLSGLQAATIYTVTVRAIDIKGNPSAFSNSLQVTTLPSSTEATEYFSQGGDLTLASNWNTAPDGSGSSPVDFAQNNQHFILVQNGELTSPWTISGADARLIVDTGVSLTLTNALTGTVDARENATVAINTTTPPSFGILSASSTVTFSSALNTIPGATYGNLMLEGDGSVKNFGAGTYTLNGDLMIGTGITLNGATGNNTIVNLSGDLNVTGVPTLPADNMLLSVNFMSGDTQNISSPSAALRFHQIRISDTTHVNWDEITANSITLGSTGGGGLIVESASTFSVGDNTLIIHGAGTINALNQTGQLSVSQADVEINTTGAALSNLYFVPGADTLNAIRINANPSGQVNIRSKMYINDIVDLGSGRLNSNDNLTLVSDADHTARIGVIGNNGTMLGKVEFQRYFHAKGRVYRYVGAPVFGSTVADWNAYFPISGPFQGSTSPSIGNSLFYYDDNNNGWIPFPEATNSETFAVGRGYSLYIFQGSTPNKLRISGNIQQGNFTYPGLTGDFIEGPEEDNTPGNGWHLLANPYASPIQWGNEGWEASNLNGTVYVRSNEMVDGQIVTSIKMWDGTVGNLTKGLLTQGQAFWVKASGPETPALTISETAKYDTVNSTLQRAVPVRNVMEVTLSNGSLKDETYIRFTDHGSLDVDPAIDAFKLANSYFNLSSTVGGTNLGINNLPNAVCETTVSLNVKNAPQGQYALTFEQIGSFDYEVQAKLIDHFTNIEIPVTEGTVYNFSVTANAASAAGRFDLQISKPDLDPDVAFTTSTSAVCGEDMAAVALGHTQRGVRYQITRGAEIIREIVGTGDPMTVQLSSSMLHEGMNRFGIKAAFEGCEITLLASTLDVEYLAKPAVTITGQTLISSSEAGNQWMLEGNPIHGATGPTFSPEYSGEYSVTVSESSCTVSSDPVLFAVTGAEVPDEDAFILFPNPVRTRFLVKLPDVVPVGEKLTLTIYNAQGLLVDTYERIQRNEDIELDVTGHGSGLYSIRIQALNRRFEKRFIKE